MKTVAKFLGKLAKLFLLLLPMLLISFSMATGGLVKFLGMLGLKDWQSNEYFYVLFQGLPGLIYAIASFFAGAGFVIIISQKFLIDYFNFTIIPDRFVDGLKKTAWISFGVLLLLWFIGDSQRSEPIIDRQIVNLPAAQVRRIIVDFPADRLAYYRKKVRIYGQPDTTECSIEIVRKIGAWNQNYKEEVLKNYLYTCEIKETDDLHIGGQVAVADWSFYPYPEIEFVITVPEKQLINLSTRASDSDKETKIELGGLQGPIKIELHQSSLQLSQINSSEIIIKMDSGRCELDKVTAEILKINSDSGQLKVNGLNSQTAELQTLSGSQNIYDLKGESAKITSQSGSIKIDTFSVNAFDCESKSGGIRLEPRALPDFPRLDIKSESGAVWVYLPEDSNPKVTMQSNTGIRQNQFEKQAQGSVNPVINVQTISGSIRIKRTNDQNRPATLLPAEALPGQ